MLPNYFDYIFVHLRQKVRLRPELCPKLLSTLGPNLTQKARPDLPLRGKQITSVLPEFLDMQIAGVHGNKVADYLVKSGSKSKTHGPE